MFSDGARLDPWRGRGPAVGSLIWLPGDEVGEGEGEDGDGVDSDPGDDGGHGSAGEPHIINMFLISKSTFEVYFMDLKVI